MGQPVTYVDFQESKHALSLETYTDPTVTPPTSLPPPPAVTEWGDDVRPFSEDEAMVIVNHQATGDVCTLMMCLQDKGTVRRDRTVTAPLPQCLHPKLEWNAPCVPL